MGTDGTSLSADSPDECGQAASTRRSYGWILVNVLIGHISALTLAKSLKWNFKRRFYYRESWNTVSQKEILNRMRTKMWAFWGLGCSVLLLYIVFIVMFLAEVSFKDHIDFLLATFCEV